MMRNLPPCGVITPLLTPFNEDLSLALDLYQEHAHWLLAQGTHHLAPFGTTGEALSLSLEERLTALDALIDDGIDPARLMPGVGLCNLPETLTLCRHAVERGCVGVMTLPPFFYKNATEEGLYAYFDQLIHMVDEPDLRICLYHIPPMAGIGFSPMLAGRLAEQFPDVVVAYKDSSGDFNHLQAVLKAAPRLSVFPGAETWLWEGMKAGGAGCISASCNINPVAVRRVYDLIVGDQEGDLAASNEAMVEFRRTIEGYAPIPAMKGLLAMGRAEPRWGNVRPPLQAVNETETTVLRTRLDDSLQPLCQ